MTDRRGLLPLLLLACLTVTGCGPVAGSGGETAATAPSAPVRAGGSAGASVRPPQTRSDRAGTAETGTAGGSLPLPLPLPLPLLLALASGSVVAAAAGVHLWRRNRRPAPAPATWHAAPSAPSAPSAPQTLWRTLPRTPATPHAAPHPPTPYTASHAPAGAPEPSGAPLRRAAPAASGPMAEALAEVAGSGISQALAQQVERLFAEGPPGREALVEACIGCRDQIAERHPGLAGTLLDGLNRAGVREIVADGQRFDPRVHEAFGTEPTERPELHDVVAETVKRGYADGDRVIRVPQVAVYRHGAPGAGTAP
ncbi:nucleotide exchange factor GrpE [Streptosporangium roseum]|uniref:nucleotide exchange factor GrpE n=1 Tax=Streptosporangium roseum TaxID=2001 RepID=UPI00068A204B|nr:nucleotide exchange factor GrpE [Streptosporangium roseum]